MKVRLTENACEMFVTSECSSELMDQLKKSYRSLTRLRSSSPPIVDGNLVLTFLRNFRSETDRSDLKNSKKLSPQPVGIL